MEGHILTYTFTFEEVKFKFLVSESFQWTALINSNCAIDCDGGCQPVSRADFVYVLQFWQTQQSGITGLDPSWETIAQCLNSAREFILLNDDV